MKFLLIPSHNFTSVILLEILIELLALRYVHLLSLFLGQGSTVKAGWIVVFAFGVFIILVFLLATMLIYYEQWKISHRPLLSCGPPRGWRLRQLQGDAPPAPATDVPPPPAADSSLDYHIEEGELMLSESEEERMERTHQARGCSAVCRVCRRVLASLPHCHLQLQVWIFFRKLG